MGKIKNMKEGAKRWGRTVDNAVVEEVDLEQGGGGDRWRTGENKVNGLIWTWATTKEGGTNNAKWREDGIGKEREKEKSLLEKQQTSTSGVNTHAVANTGATEKSWWSSIEK